MSQTRRLAAILAADVAGYSRLMGADEEGTHERLKAHLRELVEPKIAEHRGRTVKNTGDGFLAEFASVVDAVRCAVEIQCGTADCEPEVPEERRIRFRIGINVGDVIVEEHDIFGDGVNVAARLEGLAEPGGISISEDAFRQVRGKVEVEFADMGEQTLKNIVRPLCVYRVSPSNRSAIATPAALLLPDKPSIAVLPFQNMSGDPEQEYFTDGMVEEIITALSRIRWLFVIARNSSFIYKGRAVDVKQVARELGVRYVLEGSVRKADNRVRITGQLIDTASGAHIWADRFDDTLNDIFELQDQVAASVAGAIEPKLLQSEIDRAARKPTESLGAYDFYLRALARFHLWMREDRGVVIELLRQALALDPRCAPAAGLFAMCQSIQMLPGLISDEEIAEGARIARLAVDAGMDEPDALWRGGFGIWVLGDDEAAGLTAFERAVALNPNCAQAWTYLACLHGYSNRSPPAIAAAQRAMRLSPLDPLRWQFNAFLGLAHLVAGRHEEALDLARRALHEQPRSGTSMDVAAAACGHLGRIKEGREWVERLRQLRPGWNIAAFQRCRGRIASPEVRARFVEGFRKAGLPEE